MCDEYGADHNGTYYTGAAGDLFVERGTQHIIQKVLLDTGTTPDQVITMGSSMGGTAALKFGMRLGVRGIVAVCPHIDLDICAVRQDRWRHVAFICPDGDPVGAQNHVYTRQIRRYIEELDGRTPPRLFMQSCADDTGVHAEQVLPLVDTWRRQGGRVDLDERPKGGHTSDWATRALLLDAAERILAGEDIDLPMYQTQAPYLGALTRDPLSHQLRRRASLTRKRLRMLISPPAGRA